jgi:hypothetical protein
MEQLLRARGADRGAGRGLGDRRPRGLLRLGSRVIRWRVSWIWYALAIAVPLFVHVASTSVNVALGASAPSLSMLTPPAAC